MQHGIMKRNWKPNLRIIMEIINDFDGEPGIIAQELNVDIVDLKKYRALWPNNKLNLKLKEIGILDWVTRIEKQAQELDKLPTLSMPEIKAVEKRRKEKELYSYPFPTNQQRLMHLDRPELMYYPARRKLVNYDRTEEIEEIEKECLGKKETDH